MHRTKVILFPPRASEPHHRDLAMGIRGVWACALHVAGANVFAPMRVLDPDDDPFEAVQGVRGASLMHDGAPLDGSIDVVVLSELICGSGGWRCRVRIVRPDGSEIVLPGRRHGNLCGVLDAMTTTLHAVARALDLALPEDIGWRELLRNHTVAGAIAALRAEGERALRHAKLEPSAIVH